MEQMRLQRDPTGGCGTELRAEEKVRSRFIDRMRGNLRRLSCRDMKENALAPGPPAANNIIPEKGLANY